MPIADAGKGDDRRKCQKPEHIENLRWELWQRTTSPERKEEIKQELKQLGDIK